METGKGSSGAGEQSSESTTGEKKSTKKSKSAKDIGIFAIDFDPKSKSAAKKSERPAEEAWTMPLFAKAAEADQSKPDKAAEPTPEAVEAGDALSQPEQQYVTEALVRAKRMHAAETPDEAPAPQAELHGPLTQEAHVAAEQNVAEFHENILAGHDPEEAFQTQLAKIAELEPAELTELDAVSDTEAEPAEAGDESELFDEAAEAEEDAPMATPPPQAATPPAQPSRPATVPPNRRQSSVLGAISTPVGAGYHHLNPLAAGPGAGASLRREHISLHDESFLAPIAGAVVGYLIGRRHGRKKAEKQLVPVQKKLEKRVEDLQQDLYQKEQTIRQAARARLRAATAPVAEKRAHIAERRVPAPEAQRLHGPAPAREQIGQMLVGAEAIAAGAALAFKPELVRGPATPASVERIKTDTTKLVEQAKVIDKSVEHLSRSELMNLSDKIVIEGSSLRQIYETNLIGERGLRRLVAEHLRGGDLQKALRQEIVEREIDFERDPVMRDLPGSGTASGATTRIEPPHSKTLDGLLAKAGAAIPGNEEELSFMKARAEYQEKERAKQVKQRHIIDASIAGTIVFLAACIVVLFITR